ncbi:hypothetical protein BT63DRAFT_409273 [Microthyrium microscopicum]|uniref:Uncharacterized protein n=1 Tax=Microthyrium microscopicum TaxID=703497 RepID=A0A6A6US98_9PEZI|nr:hypothetical protein BT63DRAFT_409273 [Microthyrium microscopicum]
MASTAESSNSLKRSNPSDLSSESLNDSPKRLRWDHSQRQPNGFKSKQGVTDRSTGQQFAFPGLEQFSDSDADDGVSGEERKERETMREALAFLREVRSEAAAIPQIMIAPKPQLPSDEDDDYYSDDSLYNDSTRGFYADGAYVAAPPIGPIMPPNYKPSNASTDLPTPCAAYTHRLLSALSSQRTLIASTPHKAIPDGAPASITRYMHFGHFRTMLREYPPRHTHLAALSQSSVLNSLVCALHLLRRRQNVDKQISSWIWGLFCALGDVGTLDSEGVSVVRELGKRAVWMGIGFLGGEGADLTEGYGEEEEELDEEEDEMEISSTRGTAEVLSTTIENGSAQGSSPGALEEDVSESMARRRNTSSPEDSDDDPELQGTLKDQGETLEAAKARLLEGMEIKAEPAPAAKNKHTASTDENCPDANTRATIDMIITIAGEVYGQRDLLEFRQVWGGEMGLWG